LPQLFTIFLTIFTNEYNQNNIITFSISEFREHFTTNYRDIVNNNCQGIQQITSRWLSLGLARREHRRALVVGGEAGGLGRVPGGRASWQDTDEDKREFGELRNPHIVAPLDHLPPLSSTIDEKPHPCSREWERSCYYL
jgi:hypothetical protein